MLFDDQGYIQKIYCTYDAVIIIINDTLLIFTVLIQLNLSISLLRICLERGSYVCLYIVHQGAAPLKLSSFLSTKYTSLGANLTPKRFSKMEPTHQNNKVW